MLERPLYNLTDDLQQGHPHDLLAKLYREIGISAVAAALEVTKSVPAPEKTTEAAGSATSAAKTGLAA